MTVARHFDPIFCDNRLEVTLVAPDGATMRLDVLDTGGKVLGSAVSADGSKGTVTLTASAGDCYLGGQTRMVAQVSWQGARRTAADYVLTRTGSL